MRGMNMGKVIGSVFSKLNDRRGESLAETLIALIIASMGMMILAGAIVASGRVNAGTKNDLFDKEEVSVSEAAGVTIYIENSDKSVSMELDHAAGGSLGYGATDINVYEAERESGEKYYYWSAEFEDN